MQDQITFEDLLKRISNQRTKIVISIISVLVLIAGYTLVMPQTYLSSTTLMPPENSSSGGLSSFIKNVGSMIDLGGGKTDDKSKLMKSILQSRSVSVNIIEKLNLKQHQFFKELDTNDLVKLVPTFIDAEIEKSGVIVVTGRMTTDYLSNDEEKKKAANLSADIAKTAVQSLDDILISKSVSAARKSRIYIEDEIIKYEVKLDSVSKELEKFQIENKVLALEEQTQAIVNQAIELNSELTKMKTELNLAEIQFSQSSPAVKSLRKQVQFLETQSKNLQSGNSGDQFSIPLNEVPTLTRKYLDLYRDKKILVSVITYLETQRHQEAIQEAKEVPLVEVLDPAIVPYKRFSPQRGTIMIVSFFVTSFIVLIIFLILAYRDIRRAV
jgi:tyrosine-protein kinase Etk/Wzc